MTAKEVTNCIIHEKFNFKVGFLIKKALILYEQDKYQGRSKCFVGGN